jgi:hypothetical protein
MQNFLIYNTYEALHHQQLIIHSTSTIFFLSHDCCEQHLGNARSQNGGKRSLTLNFVSLDDCVSYIEIYNWRKHCMCQYNLAVINQ